VNSKERLKETIRRRPTDRTPTHFRAEPETLEKIYRRTGIRDYERLLDYLDSDIRYVDAVYPADQKYDGFYQNCWGERHVFKDSEFGPVRELIDGALKDAKSLDEIKNFNWPTVDDLDYGHIGAFCQRHASRGITYALADFWTRPSNVRGMENFLMDLVLHPEYCHFLANYFTEFYIKDFRRAYQASNKQIDLFLTYTDLGTQTAPLVSMKVFREFVKPYLKRLADVVHELGAFLFYHSCGMVFPFIEDFIDAGVDVLDPIQPCMPEMQPENLQKHFGDRLCFHGGIDVQGVLGSGTPEDVRNTVLRYEKAFEHCGYIISSSHYLQMDASVENIFAIFDKSVDGLAISNRRPLKTR
jgi:uroporphyrinogen decarboxylase